MRSFFVPRHPRSVATLSMLVLLASCLPGAHAPQVTSSRTLNLEGEATAAASAKAFAVVFAGPKGKDRRSSRFEVRARNCYRETPHHNCAARDSLDIELSNRVSQKEWRAHVVVE